MKTFEEPASVLEDVGNLIGCRRRYEELYLARTCDSAKAVAGVTCHIHYGFKFVIEVKGIF